MIRYALRCDRSHAFESWFQSSSAYDSQVKRKLVTCPICGSAKVEQGDHGAADRRQEGPRQRAAAGAGRDAAPRQRRRNRPR